MRSTSDDSAPDASGNRASKPKKQAQMTPENRRLRAEVAAHTSWANTADRKARTAPARQAALSRFEVQVDPDGTMDPLERARRADSARKAHFRAMAYKSARVRAARKASGS